MERPDIIFCILKSDTRLLALHSVTKAPIGTKAAFEVIERFICAHPASNADGYNINVVLATVDWLYSRVVRV